MTTPICFYSSYLFLLNSIIFYFNQDYIYSYLFKYLTTTSLLYHSERENYKKSTYYRVIDIFMVLTLFIYGSYYIYDKLNKKIYISFRDCICLFIILLCNFLIGILHFYGKIIHDYCSHPNCFISEYYHSLLHLYVFCGNLFVFLL